MRSCVRFWIGELRATRPFAIHRDVNTDEGTDFRERAAYRLLRFLTGCRLIVPDSGTRLPGKQVRRLM
jgi:hypothetical protein